MTQWMQFIALRPAVVLIDMQHKPHLIRKRETLGVMEECEIKPDYLANFKL
jgi:diaminopimelate decarboxylase